MKELVKGRAKGAGEGASAGAVEGVGKGASVALKFPTCTQPLALFGLHRIGFTLMRKLQISISRAEEFFFRTLLTNTCVRN